MCGAVSTWSVSLLLLKFILIIYLLIFVYTILIFIAVYRSADNYIGNKLWPFLSKVIISINVCFSLFSAYDLLRVTIVEDYAIKSEINSFKDSLPLKVNSYSHLTNIGIEEKNIYYTYYGQLCRIYLLNPYTLLII